jgi:hypothetical protein
VFGILGCVPEITGLLAIIFGIAGLRRARDPRVGGKGLAGAGLSLGIVSVIAWSGIIGFVTLLGVGSGPARDVARQYLADYSHGNLPAVMQATSASVSPAQVQSLSDRLVPLGNLQDVQFVGVYLGYSFSPEWRLNGRAKYANGWALFTIKVVRQGDAWKVQDIQINPQVQKPMPVPNTIQT